MTSRPVWFEDAQRLERLYEYCARDVDVTRALFERLPPLSPDEQAIWALDAKINARGFCVDVELAHAARKLVHHEQVAIDVEIAAVTNGAITTVGQVGKITEFVRERGHQLAGLTKRSVSAVLARGKPDQDVRRLLELRREGGLASVRKLDALFIGVDADGRLRGTLRYHGAATGRWSSARFQVQNLKRPESGDIASAIDAVLTGDLDNVRELGAPLTIVGDTMRAMIRAAPEHVIVAGDFSAIESRVLAWLAGESWKLNGYHAFDRTGDPTLEPYCVTASRILRRAVTPADEAGRFIGKTADLALGFGGAAGAWRRFDPDGHSDQEVSEFVQRWRQSHPATTRFWRRLESAIKRAIRGGERGTLGNLAFEFEDGTLRVVLPSGRRISYPGAHLVPGKFAGTSHVAFMDNARGGWSETRGWYGTFVENVVQATARDLLAAAMQRVETAGFPIVLHVHDELVAEVPADRADTAEFHRLMVEPPSWATGLPIAAKVRSGERFSKSEAKPKPRAKTPAPEPTPVPAPAPAPEPAMIEVDENGKVYHVDF